RFQQAVPVREAHYSLQLPAGWEYKASWMNFPEVKPAENPGNQTSWSVNNVEGIRPEEDMPPLRGVAGRLVISFFPSGATALNAFANWRQMGSWYTNLTNGRDEASPELKQKVTELTANAHGQVEKMQALAQFIQHDIRYVGIELGI